MSLILDALRKMELERKARRLSSQPIRTEVLNYRGTAPPPEKFRIGPIMVSILLVATVAGVFIYLYQPAAQKPDLPKQRETAKLETAPAVPPLPAPLPPAELQMPKSLPGVATGTASSAKPLPQPETVKPRSGPEGITVTGIAWQDEHSLRRAVINGALVGEGAEVQGAKVVEIRENRVRFSRGGEIFEVLHTAGSGR